MVLDMARPKNKESTTRLGMRGRDAVRKLTLKVNILQAFTIDFSEIQFVMNHNSQSDGQNRSAQSGINFQKKTIHIISLQRKGEDAKDNGFLLWTKQAKMAHEASIWFSSRCLDEKSSTSRIRRTSWSASPSRSTKTMALIFQHIVVGQVWMELEVSSLKCF